MTAPPLQLKAAFRTLSESCTSKRCFPGRAATAACGHSKPTAAASQAAGAPGRSRSRRQRLHDSAGLAGGGAVVEHGELVGEAVLGVAQAQKAQAVPRVHGQQVGDPEGERLRVPCCRLLPCPLQQLHHPDAPPAPRIRPAAQSVVSALAPYVYLHVLAYTKESSYHWTTHRDAPERTGNWASTEIHPGSVYSSFKQPMARFLGTWEDTGRLFERALDSVDPQNGARFHGAGQGRQLCGLSAASRRCLVGKVARLRHTVPVLLPRLHDAEPPPPHHLQVEAPAATQQMRSPQLARVSCVHPRILLQQW